MGMMNEEPFSLARLCLILKKKKTKQKGNEECKKTHCTLNILHYL